MRIGIDVDGVFTDIERYLWDYGSKYSYQLGKTISIDPSKYTSKDMFSWDIETDDMFWKGMYDDYCENVKIREFASEVIKKLRKEGHQIYIITARGSDAYISDKDKKKSDKMLIKWLKNNKVKYDKLIITGQDKLKSCTDNNIELMIEDCPNNLKQISKKIPMICMYSNYNAKCKGKNIIHCHTWYEIYDKINQFIKGEEL